MHLWPLARARMNNVKISSKRVNVRRGLFVLLSGAVGVYESLKRIRPLRARTPHKARSGGGVSLFSYAWNPSQSDLNLILHKNGVFAPAPRLLCNKSRAVAFDTARGYVATVKS